jgi:lipid-A-disaccharide synthase-like uncharacterized protein
MKAGPVAAMVVLMLLGMWLVLQPSLSRQKHDLRVRVGAVELLALQLPPMGVGGASGGGEGSGAAAGLARAEHRYRFVSPARLAKLGDLDGEGFDHAVADEIAAWNARSKFERTLLGFFNITEWGNLVWVLIGLGGQAAFFGRMMVQWVVSEKSRESQVPELFWWFSLAGGLCLFAYFVWRVDAVGVLGQSTGIVIYARNLRLIGKSKRREERLESGRGAQSAEATENTSSPENAQSSSSAVRV